MNRQNVDSSQHAEYSGLCALYTVIRVILLWITVGTVQGGKE